jgi:hypothetical protein
MSFGLVLGAGATVEEIATVMNKNGVQGQEIEDREMAHRRLDDLLNMFEHYQKEKTNG